MATARSRATEAVITLVSVSLETLSAGYEHYKLHVLLAMPVDHTYN